MVFPKKTFVSQLGFFSILSLLVACGGGGSETTDKSVQDVKNENTAPVITGSPAARVYVNQMYSFTPQASDADNDNLVFSIHNKPAWLSFEQQTGTLSGKPALEDKGTSTAITISVTDSKQSTSLPVFTIDVIQAANNNQAPVINGSPLTQINTGETYQFTPNATDSDGDVLTYSVMNKPDWAQFDTATGRLTGSPTHKHIKQFENIQISVTDGKSPRVILPAFDLTVTVSPDNYQKLLKVGIDVDWAKTNPGITHYNQQAAQDFAERGISHVRIRVADTLDTPVGSATLLDHIETIIDDAMQQGLIPVLAYQGAQLKECPLAGEIKTDGSLCTEQEVSDNHAAYLAWWQAVAERFQNRSHLLAFNLLIETTENLGKLPDVLNEVYAQVIPVVRQTNPARILIAPPIKISNPEYLNQLQLPADDPFLMAEWHFYAAGPQKDNPKKQWITGSLAEQQLITDKINIARDWQNNHIPT